MNSTPAGAGYPASAADGKHARAVEFEDHLLNSAPSQ